MIPKYLYAPFTDKFLVEGRNMTTGDVVATLNGQHVIIREIMLQKKMYKKLKKKYTALKGEEKHLNDLIGDLDKTIEALRYDLEASAYELRLQKTLK